MPLQPLGLLSGCYSDTLGADEYHTPLFDAVYKCLFLHEPDDIYQLRHSQFTSSLESRNISQSLHLSLIQPFLSLNPTINESLLTKLLPLLCCSFVSPSFSLTTPGETVSVDVHPHHIHNLFHPILTDTFTRQDLRFPIPFDLSLIKPSPVSEPEILLDVVRQAKTNEFTVIIVNSADEEASSQFSQHLANLLKFDVIIPDSVVRDTDLYQSFNPSEVLESSSSDFCDSICKLLTEKQSIRAGVVLHNIVINHLPNQFLDQISSYNCYGLNLDCVDDSNSCYFKNSLSQCRFSNDDIEFKLSEFSKFKSWLERNVSLTVSVPVDIQVEAQSQLVFEHFPILAERSKSVFDPVTSSFESISEAVQSNSSCNLPFGITDPIKSKTQSKVINGSPEFTLVFGKSMYFCESEESRVELIQHLEMNHHVIPQFNHVPNVLILDPLNILSLMDQHLIVKKISKNEVFERITLGSEYSEFLEKFKSETNLPPSKFAFSENDNDSPIPEHFLIFSSIDMSDLSSVLPQFFSTKLSPKKLIVLLPETDGDTYFTFAQMAAKKFLTDDDIVPINLYKTKILEHLNSPNYFKSDSVIAALVPSFVTNTATRVTDPSGKTFLEGFCPMTLLIDGDFIKGNPEFSAFFNGNYFQFTNEEHLSTFLLYPSFFFKQFSSMIPPARIIHVYLSKSFKTDWLSALVIRNGFKFIDALSLVKSDDLRPAAQKEAAESDNEDDPEEAQEPQESESDKISKYLTTFVEALSTKVKSLSAADKSVVVVFKTSINDHRDCLFHTADSDPQLNLIGGQGWFEQLPSNLKPNACLFLTEDVDSIVTRLKFSKELGGDIELPEEISNYFEYISAIREASIQQDQRISEEIRIAAESQLTSLDEYSTVIQEVYPNCSVQKLGVKQYNSKYSLKISKFFKHFAGKQPPFLFKTVKIKSKVRPVHSVFVLSCLEHSVSKKIAAAIGAMFIDPNQAFADLLLRNPDHHVINQILKESQSDVVSDYNVLSGLLLKSAFNCISNHQFVLIQCDFPEICENVKSILNDHSPINYLTHLIVPENVTTNYASSPNSHVFVYSHDVDVIDFALSFREQSISPLQLDSVSHYVCNSLFPSQRVVPCAVHFALKDEFPERNSDCLTIFQRNSLEKVNTPLLCDTLLTNFKLFASAPSAFSLFNASKLIPVPKETSHVNKSIAFQYYCPFLLSQQKWFRSDQSFLIEIDDITVALYDDVKRDLFLKRPHYYLYLAEIEYSEKQKDQNFALLFADDDTIKQLPVPDYINFVFTSTLETIFSKLSTNEEVPQLIYPGLDHKSTLFLLIVLGLRAFNPRNNFKRRVLLTNSFEEALNRCKLFKDRNSENFGFAKLKESFNRI
ncbi:hypothetical protein GEMRC1_008218 [Eukaryota sp. GEM-RC1]